MIDLAAALGLHRSGRLHDAEAAYQQLLQSKPENAEVWQLLGALAYQQQRFGDAISRIKQAIQLGPARASWFYNLAGAQRQKGDLEAALASYRQALEISPNDRDFRVNFAATLLQAQCAEEAADVLQAYVDGQPDDAEAWSNLGAARQATGQLREACRSYQRAVELCPDSSHFLGNLGEALRQLGDYDAAIASLERAVSIAVADTAASHSARHRLAQAYRDAGRLSDALAEYRRALALAPEAYETLVNLAGVLAEQGEFGEAAATLDRAVALAPDRFEAHNNLGLCWQDQGAFDAALACFDRAIALAPHDISARLNRAFCYLQAGDLACGWREYQWRRRREPEHGAEQPTWRGQSLAGKSILVHAEQGLGDEIMFATCLPDLLAETDRLTVTCDRRLAPLLARSFPTAKVLPVNRGAEPWADLARLPVDYQSPAGELLRYLRPTANCFPRPERLFEPNASLASAWRARLAALGPGLKVGLSWRGGLRRSSPPRNASPAYTDDSPAVLRKRCLPLDALLPLGKLVGVQWIALQYDLDAAEVDTLRAAGVSLHVFPDLDCKQDLEGLAALMSELDVVLSAANATAHLAGAIGAETWVLLPRFWGWRWPLENEPCRWYRRVRACRQSAHGDWNGLVHRLTAELADRAVAPHIRA